MIISTQSFDHIFFFVLLFGIKFGLLLELRKDRGEIPLELETLVEILGDSLSLVLLGERKGFFLLLLDTILLLI